jgi:GT2 family glycosyltransferase
MAIDKLLNFAKKQSSDFFVGGKLLNNDGSPQPSCGPFYSLPVVFAALFLRGDYWGLTRYSPIVNRRVDWVSGACLLTNNTTFNKLNGFDEKIFMYMEEIDLLFRAKKAGILTYFVHSAIFTHLGSASSGGKSYPIIQVFRGFSYFYNKHHGPLSKFMLKNMLQFKAYLVIFIAGILKKPELAKTYESAKNNIKLD